MPLIIPGNSQASTGYTIDQSIRFNDDDNPYMGRTPSATGTEETWTWSFWVKRATLGTLQVLFQIGADKNNCDQFYFNTDDQLQYQHLDSGSNTDDLETTQVFRDPSAWIHIILAADTTNAVESERIRIYVNGERVTNFATENYPTQNTPTDVNTQVLHQIGAQLSATYFPFDGYMAEIHLLDGLAYDPSFFGEFNNSGIWIAKEYTGSYGTNGFYIKGQLAGATNAITALGNIQHSTAQAKIGSSSILFDGNGDLLEVGGTSNWYDFGADGNPWTMEAYIRFDTVSITQKIFWQNNTYIGIEYVTGSGIKVRLNNGGINFTASWSPSINTWYHIAVVRQTNNTTTVYIDGTSIGSGTISGGSSSQHKVEIGAFSPSTDEFDGYMDEIRISSVARFTSSFTPTTSEYTADGDTLALIHSNTTNGSTVFKNDVGFGNDSSGNQNNFATSGLAVHDQVSDSPSNNFAVINPIYADNAPAGNAGTLSNGNLQYVGGGSTFSVKGLTFNLPKSGKWYFEYMIGGTLDGFGFVKQGEQGTMDASSGPGRLLVAQGGGIQYSGWRNDGDFTVNFADSNTGSPFTAGFIHQVAIDVDNGKHFYGVKNTYYAADTGSDGNPSAGTNETSTFAFSTTDVVLLAGNYSGTQYWNFGQDGTFAGQQTAQGNSDANGVGNFYYAPPTGYLALCTKNVGS